MVKSMKNWTHNKTKKQVKDRMKQLAITGAERRKLAFSTLKKVEEIKEQWNREDQKWSKELKETIITNLFN